MSRKSNLQRVAADSTSSCRVLLYCTSRRAARCQRPSDSRRRTKHCSCCHKYGDSGACHSKPYTPAGGAAEAEGKTVPTKQVLLIMPEQSMDMELMLTKEVSVMMSELEKGGYKVVVTSASGQPLTGGATTVKPDLKLADVKAGDYAGLILPWLAVPDGYQPPSEELEIIRTVLSQGKPVAAQNGGVWALNVAGGLKDKQFAYLEDPGASFEAGAYKGYGVVQDGNIITSGSCPFTAQMTGRTDGTIELTQKLIDSLDARKQ